MFRDLKHSKTYSKLEEFQTNSKRTAHTLSTEAKLLLCCIELSWQVLCWETRKLYTEALCTAGNLAQSTQEISNKVCLPVWLLGTCTQCWLALFLLSAPLNTGNCRELCHLGFFPLEIL